MRAAPCSCPSGNLNQEKLAEKFDNPRGFPGFAGIKAARNGALKVTPFPKMEMHPGGAMAPRLSSRHQRPPRPEVD